MPVAVHAGDRLQRSWQLRQADGPAPPPASSLVRAHGASARRPARTSVASITNWLPARVTTWPSSAAVSGKGIERDLRAYRPLQHEAVIGRNGQHDGARRRQSVPLARSACLSATRSQSFASTFGAASRTSRPSAFAAPSRRSTTTASAFLQSASGQKGRLGGVGTSRHKELAFRSR